MKEKLKILIANDDGIRSEGIAKLARAAASFGTVWVAAPEHQCSGMSVRLTISEMFLLQPFFLIPLGRSLRNFFVAHKSNRHFSTSTRIHC